MNKTIIIQSDFGAYFKSFKNKEAIWTLEENEAKHFSNTSPVISNTISLLKKICSIENIKLLDVNALNSKHTASKE